MRPGLFGRHVRQATGNDFRRRRRLALARQSRRDAKAGEPYVAGVVGEHVPRLDVFVDQTALVGMAERRRQADCKPQETGRINWLFLALLKPVPIENAVQGLTARVG